MAIVRFLYDGAGRSALADEPRFSRVHPALRLSVVSATALDERFSPESRAALRDVQPAQLEFLRQLNEAGAGILIGTDSVVPGYVPGFTVIDEIKVLASGGIPAFDVLRAATVGAAELLGIDERRGTLETGKEASFIMVAGNPLEDLDQLWSLRGVVHQGRYRTLADIEAMLDQQMASVRWEPPGDD